MVFMNKLSVFKLSLVISVIGLIAGYLLKTQHNPNVNYLISAGYGASIALVVLCLFEVFSSKKNQLPEKIMWTMGFLFVCSITAIVYIAKGRKGII
jgi:drug/metabolite transporter (DMT)-like permease